MGGHLKIVRPYLCTSKQLADFLADYPIPDDWELNDDLLGEDEFYIDILPS